MAPQRKVDNDTSNVNSGAASQQWLTRELLRIISEMDKILLESNRISCLRDWELSDAKREWQEADRQLSILRAANRPIESVLMEEREVHEAKVTLLRRNMRSIQMASSSRLREAYDNLSAADKRVLELDGLYRCAELEKQILRVKLKELQANMVLGQTSVGSTSSMHQWRIGSLQGMVSGGNSGAHPLQQILDKSDQDSLAPVLEELRNWFTGIIGVDLVPEADADIDIDIDIDLNIDAGKNGGEDATSSAAAPPRPNQHEYKKLLVANKTSSRIVKRLVSEATAQKLVNEEQGAKIDALESANDQLQLQVSAAYDDVSALRMELDKARAMADSISKGFGNSGGPAILQDGSSSSPTVGDAIDSLLQTARMEEAQAQHERIAHAEQQVQEMQVEIHKLRAWKNDAIDKER